MGVDPTAVHPATRKRELVEEDLRHRLSRYVSARVLHNRKEADQEYVDRCRDEYVQGIQNLKDACYAEIDASTPAPDLDIKAESHICTCGDCESEAFADRCKFEIALRELDDGHGLGKEGLDTAREVVEDAVWFPLNRMSMGDRKDDAWLVSADKMRALAVAIGMKDELS